MDRILSKKAVLQITSWSASSLDRREKAGEFPKRIKIGPNRIGWLEHEIDEWIAQKSEERPQHSDLTMGDQPVLNIPKKGGRK